MKADTDSLKEYSTWCKLNPEMSLFGFAACALNEDQLVAAAELFFPHFISYEGGVFLTEFFQESLFWSWHNTLTGEISKVEKVMNHRHVRNMLHAGENLSNDNVRFLGSVLENTWKCAAKCQFPQAEFVSKGIWDFEEADYVITIYQE